MAPARFLTVVEPPVPPSGELPRMDVAAFAGFAEAGPFGVPVCVESPDTFAAVFGRPPQLPGGPGRLADAADAFFAQGGRRLWVVRCGGGLEPPAPARFELPGVLAVLAGAATPADDLLRPASLPARSAGTFADGLRVTTGVRRDRLVVAPQAGGGLRIVASDRAVVPGALVELGVLRGGVPARRLGWLAPAPRPGEHTLTALLTVADAPALPADTELAGQIGPLAARMARDAAGRARIRVELPPGGEPPVAIGGLVRFVADPARPPLPARALRRPEPDTWLLVAQITASRAGSGNPAVVLSGPAVHVDREPDGELQPGIGFALTLELAGRSLAGGSWRLPAVGCTPSAPGWPGTLRSDAARYTDATGPVAPAPVALCGDGLDDVLALVPILSAAFGVEAGPQTRGSAAVRNGVSLAPVRELLGRHDDLADTSVYALGAMVGARDRSGQPAVGGLPGIVALMDAPEATLLAVPDAVLADAAAPAPVTAPGPARLPAPEVDDAAAGFGTCAPRPDTPALADAQLGGDGGATLSWIVAAATTQHEVGLFTTPSATAPDEILYRGPAEIVGSSLAAGGGPATVLGITLAPTRPGWARVRAFDARGRAGGWSIGVRLAAPSAAGAAAGGDALADDLRTVHGVLLRLAALRGDALAILSVPIGWGAEPAAAHVAALQAELGASERRALAFGTLAHPWPRVPAPAPQMTRPLPPDGVLAGQLAAMAAQRGAWIAVSDRPLRGAVDTTDSAGDRRAAGPANRYVTGVRGVSADGQDTLALDEDDRPVNVRRTVALVRRAALQRGQRTVFEPNGPALWRALHRDIDGLLALMHERGAFRPANPADAYRVDVFPGDRHADTGRCICEVRVAPSLPLRFLTVRLERQGDGALTAVGS